MDFVLIAFFAQLAVIYVLILSLEFYKRRKMVSLIGFEKKKPILKETYWRKAS